MNEGFLEITSKVNSNNSLKYILRIQVNRTESLPQTHIIQSLHPCNVHDIALQYFKLKKIRGCGKDSIPLEEN